MWPRATNPENWLPQSQFIKVISTVRIGRTGGSEIHERVAQLFVVVHTIPWLRKIKDTKDIKRAAAEIKSVAACAFIQLFSLSSVVGGSV